MQEKINKIIWIVVGILLIGLIILTIYNQNKKDDSLDRNIFYMDTYIYIKLYNNTSNEILDKVESIYKEYNNLTDRYNSYDDIKNIYYIHNNASDEEYIKLDSKLYDLLEYSKDWYEKSNKLIDISMGNVIDVWKKYRDNKNGIPTSEELNRANTESIDNIILSDGSIKNNHVNIDLGCIAKGYATQEVVKYLESINVNEYLINAGGTVYVGNHYNNDSYKIGLEDPTSNNGDIFLKIKATNKAIVTSGSYERFYEYDGKKYSHIINPNTLMPNDEFLSVSVICDDAALGDMLSTMLFLMSIEDGKEYVNSLDNVEAIWYLDKNSIIMSDGVSKYTYN